MKRTDLENRVRQVTWPEPPPGLRDRVLSAASVVVQPITWSDRMWFSRTWRLSAVAAALVLVALEQLSGSSRSAGLVPTAQALAEAQIVETTGQQVGLPPEVAASFARRTLSEAARPRAESQQGQALLQAFAVEGPGR